MAQTLLALAALLALSTYSLGQHRHAVALDRGTEHLEVELAATDLARSWLAAATDLAFDEADVGRPALRFTPHGLTPHDSLGPEAGELGPILYDDVDDYHHPEGVVTPDSVAWDGGFLPFDVAVAVRYVALTDPDAPAGSPTLAKEIVVSVRERPAAQLGRRTVSCRLRAVVSPTAQRLR
jgi:hypothetical protein